MSDPPRQPDGICIPACAGIVHIDGGPDKKQTIAVAKSSAVETSAVEPPPTEPVPTRPAAKRRVVFRSAKERV